jgi:hypothetical protein
MALPNYNTRGNMLYDPSSKYGWSNDWDYLGGLIGQEQAQNDPQSWWTRMLAEQGLGGFNTNSTVAKGLFGRAADAYGAAQLTNPELRWTDFAGNLDLQKLLADMSPQERGENQSNYAPMNVRWLPR